uniref:CUB domain-containing protein n=1 Tax=Panagrolaimus superbus TaxID=310955 RepID=A0A914YS61_9BILA
MSSFLLQPTCQFPDLPVIFSSSYRTVDFYFESDAADGFDGFSVEYKAIDDECGQIVPATPHGEFSYESSKGLTRLNQEHKRCRFFVYAKEGQPLEIEFTQFNFPSTDPSCAQEFLEIRDVGNVAECTHPACSTKPKTPTNIRYCRKNMPTRFVSQTSVVQITSSVLLSSQYTSSFTISYKLLDQCNRTVTFEAGSHFASGRLTSPNYPNSYDNNATCITSISAPLDFQILIVFKEFRVERGEGFRHRFPGIGGNNSPYWRRGGWSRFYSSPRYLYSTACSYDALKIKVLEDTHDCGYLATKINLNPSNSTISDQTFCGFTLPPSQISKSNLLDLKFTTDDSMTHGGYDLSYYSVKPILISTKNIENMFYEFQPNYERSGAITPIGFPSAYPNNTIQRFSIRPPSGLFCTFKMVSLSLTSLPDVDNCDAADTLRYKTVIATNDGGDEEHRDSNWISPCILVSVKKFA